MKFLDETGLAHLWSKIKSIIPTKTSQLTNDSGFVSDTSNFATKDRYGDTAISLGRKSGTTIGTNSVAVGTSSTASGSNSFAMGYCTASSSYSAALGVDSVATGYGAIAAGRQVKTSTEGQAALGKFNKSDTENVLIVGNGASGAESNAHTVHNDGTGWFQGDVYVGSTSGTNKDDGSIRLARTSEVITNDVIKGFWKGTQAEYNALGTYDDKILYLIPKG